MNPTWLEVLTQIRSQLNEDIERFFKDDDLLVQFNRAQLLFARETKFLRKELQLSVQGDGVTVSLPPDFLGIVAVSFTSKEDIEDGSKPTFLQLVGMHGRSSESGVRQGYFLKANDRLGLTPGLENPVDAKVLLSYYAKPTPLVDSEKDKSKEIDVLDEYVDTPIQMVIARAYLKRREHEEYQLQKQEVEIMLARDIKAIHRSMGTRNLNPPE